jgi:hypothetical protein
MIQNYRDGELDAKTAQALENHLSRCADCRREHEAFQRLSSVIAESPVPEPPAGYWETMQFSVMRQIRSQTAPRAQRTAWWQSLFFRPAFAMGVVVALAFVGGILVGRVSARPIPTESPKLSAAQPPTQPIKKSVVRDPAARSEKSRAVVQSVPTPPKSSAPKQKMKSSGKLARVVRHAPSVRRNKAPRQKRVPTFQPVNVPTSPPFDGYVVYSLEPPPLTLSSSADSVAANGSETRTTTDASAAGEVVAPVHQQLIVPLSVVNTNQRSGTPSSESSSSQESKSAPII